MKGFSVIICLLVALSLMMGLVSCGQTPLSTTSKPDVTTTSAATSAPATSAVSSAVTAKYILNLAPISCVAPAAEGSNPPPSGSSLFFANFCKLVATKTNGQVRVDPYWSQSLSPANQIVSNTGTGVCDLAGSAQDKEPGKLPLSMVAMQPGFGTDWWAMSMAWWDMMNQDPVLSELAKYNLVPLGVNFVPDYYMIATNPIRTIADLKGKKISSVGIQAQTLGVLGAVPVAMSPAEQYEGMQKKILDGNIAGFSPIADFKFYEVAKYIVKFPFGGKMQLTFINKDVWNKLPADIQAAFKSMVPDEIQLNINAFYRQGQPLFPMSDQLIKANNLEVIQPSAEDIAALQKIQAGQATAWAADTDKAGLPGSKLLADYRAAIAKYEKVSTFAFK
jgi:TRAP-type transport system periplasmic protein